MSVSLQPKSDIAGLQKSSPGHVEFFAGRVTFNPLSPKSDQHQISPCNINALQNRGS